jgi:hypothetical protein
VRRHQERARVSGREAVAPPRCTTLHRPLAQLCQLAAPAVGTLTSFALLDSATSLTQVLVD